MCTLIQYLAFSGTNLLTRCHSASSCFLLFCISEKFYRKYSRNCTGQKPNILELCHKAIARRGVAGGQPGGQTVPRSRPTSGRAWVLSRSPWPPSTPPLRPYKLHLGKTLRESRN